MLHTNTVPVSSDTGLLKQCQNVTDFIMIPAQRSKFDYLKVNGVHYHRVV